VQYILEVSKKQDAGKIERDNFKREEKLAKEFTERNVNYKRVKF
jgi:hypothetical protein